MLLDHPNIAPLLGVAQIEGSILAAIITPVRTWLQMISLMLMIQKWYERGCAHDYLKNRGVRESLSERVNLVR